jgi:hypothetical protein
VTADGLHVAALREPDRQADGTRPDDIAAALAASGVDWGVAARDVPAFESATGRDATLSAIETVAAAGGRALLLASPLQASTTLDGLELMSVRDHADALGVRLHLTLGELHPNRHDPDGVKRALGAGGILNVAAYHATVGRMEDRFSTSPTWEEALAEASRRLRALAEATDRPIVLRTHEEMTTSELLELIDSAGPSSLAIGFSPVNVVCRAEVPGTAWGRLSDRSPAVFLDDCELVPTEAGADRRLRPIGAGIVPWVDILGDLASSLEDHPMSPVAFLDLAQAEFAIPFGDHEWVGGHTDPVDEEGPLIEELAVAADVPQSPIGDRRARGWAILRESARLAARRHVGSRG